MCDFKPGDEVVCVWADYVGIGTTWCAPVAGKTYTVTETFFWDGEPHVRLAELTNLRDAGYRARRFRKVQRNTRDLEVWLGAPTPDTDHLDKPRPVRKLEPAR